MGGYLRPLWQSAATIYLRGYRLFPRCYLMYQNLSGEGAAYDLHMKKVAKKNMGSIQHEKKYLVLSSEKKKKHESRKTEKKTHTQKHKNMGKEMKTVKNKKKHKKTQQKQDKKKKKKKTLTILSGLATLCTRCAST